MSEVFESLAAADGIKETILKRQWISLYVAYLEHDRVHLIGGIAAAVEKVDRIDLMPKC